MEILLALGAGAAALTAISVASRKAINSARAFFALQTVAARLINAEMTVNSGGSLLDKVNKIAPNHRIAEDHWIKLSERQADIKRALVLSSTATDLRLVKLEKAVSEHGTDPCQRLRALETAVLERLKETP